MSYNLSTSWTVVLIVLAVWEIFWKGLALWRAARQNQRTWFVLLLVINTAGLFPVLYLLITRGQPMKTIDFSQPVRKEA